MTRDAAARLLRQLDERLLAGPGVTSPGARVAAAGGAGEGRLGELLHLAQTAAHRVTPEQLDALRAEHGDDALFELLVCAAHGAARAQLTAGLAALDAAWGDEP